MPPSEKRALYATLAIGLTGISFAVFAFLSLHHPTAALPFAISGWIFSRRARNA